jgi:hypothetical protein
MLLCPEADFSNGTAMKTATPSPALAGTRVTAFRRQIEAELAAGHSPQALTLRLTHADASHLKRDRSLAVDDISFAGGVMRFLGVRVEAGAVTVSELVHA